MVVGLLTSLLLCFLRLSISHQSSLSLSYNGGKIMTEPVTVSLLWFGSGWQESGREAIRNAIVSLSPNLYNINHVMDSEVPTLGDWWDIVRQYKDGSNARVTDTLQVGAECFFTGSEQNVTLGQVLEIGGSVFNETSNLGFGGNLSCTQVFVVNETSVYFVLFSHTVMFLMGDEQMELTDTCSGNLSLPSSRVNMSWVRAPQDPNDQCGLHGSDFLGAPNGDGRVDSVVGLVVGKMAEGVTDGDGRGWVSSDGSGLTVKSSCDSIVERGENGAPLFSDAQSNVSFNAVGLNGYRYVLPYVWDQRIGNCALKLSGRCEGNAVKVEEPKGYLSVGIVVNHSNGLQPYSPNQRCQWRLNYPGTKFISITINYLSIPSDGDDRLRICESETSHCSDFKPDAALIGNNFKLMSSKAYIEFTTGDHVPFESRGWELSYSAGLCDGKEDVYDRDGIVSYISSTGFSYAEGLTCQWVFHGKPGTLVSFTFTHINISHGLDFLAIYDASMQQVANFSGHYSHLPPPINLTGQVRLAFATQTAQGEGWSAQFHISSPVDHRSSAKMAFLVIIALILGASLSLTLIALALLIRRRRRERAGSLGPSCELIREGARVGEGPSSVVYKAFLADGSLVAVKRLKDSIPSSRKELEQEILSKSSSHPSIVSLTGHDRGRRCLVLEFSSHGSLSRVLVENGGALNWGKRLDIALQVSSAIQFLHMYMKPVAYHGNVTCDNIVLDEAYNAKLGGFGSANYCKKSSSGASLVEMGEDIKGLGLVLVELLRGEVLGDWEGFEDVNELVGGLDHRMEAPGEMCKVMALTKMGDIAKWCIVGAVNKPKIGDVLAGLKQVKKLFTSVSDC